MHIVLPSLHPSVMDIVLTPRMAHGLVLELSVVAEGLIAVIGVEPFQAEFIHRPHCKLCLLWESSRVKASVFLRSE